VPLVFDAAWIVLRPTHRDDDLNETDDEPDTQAEKNCQGRAAQDAAQVVEARDGAQ